jgi:antitoxin component of RelBE/YafQ-DinJ toxin-antitoxin module
MALQSGEERVYTGIRLTTSERKWLEAVAAQMGLSITDTARMLIREAAERRGLKERSPA